MSVAMLMDRTTTALVALLLFGTASKAQPNKEQYELQERCGKRAAEFFAKAWASEVSNTASGQTRANYENHYNSRLNKCSYLEIREALINAAMRPFCGLGERFSCQSHQLTAACGSGGPGTRTGDRMSCP